MTSRLRISIDLKQALAPTRICFKPAPQDLAVRVAQQPGRLSGTKRKLLSTAMDLLYLLSTQLGEPISYPSMNFARRHVLSLSWTDKATVIRITADTISFEIEPGKPYIIKSVEHHLPLLALTPLVEWARCHISLGPKPMTREETDKWIHSVYASQPVPTPAQA